MTIVIMKSYKLPTPKRLTSFVGSCENISPGLTDCSSKPAAGRASILGRSEGMTIFTRQHHEEASETRTGRTWPLGGRRFPCADDLLVPQPWELDQPLPASGLCR